MEKEQRDFLPIKGIDYVEFYVGNAYQAAQFYRNMFGFDIVAYAGLETKIRDRESYVLRQNWVTFVMTAGLSPESPISQHVLKHGDGVKDVALIVDDVYSAISETTKRGAKAVLEPVTLSDKMGEIRKASIATYGDTVHSFIDRSGYEGLFFPGYEKKRTSKGISCGIKDIDHVVGNVELGKMDYWVEFYENVMGFKLMTHFNDQDISTEYTALMSKVVEKGGGRVKLPINEPAVSKKRRRNQIEEYLDYNIGPGVQHIALATDNIIDTVTSLQSRGVELLPPEDSYYTSEDFKTRVGKIDEDLEVIKKLGILADRDDEGYMLQIFTELMQDRPTLFYEIIQRKGAKGFGLANFKALYEAIERRQKARGNL